MMSRTSIVMIAALAYGFYWAHDHLPQTPETDSATTDQDMPMHRETREEQQERLMAGISAAPNSMNSLQPAFTPEPNAQAQINLNRQADLENRKRICSGVNANRPECRMINSQ